MTWLPTWPPRDWRMLLALGFLAVAGAGAWLLNLWALNALIALADRLQAIWPLAYYAYGALALLAIPTLLFGIVVGLKSFNATGPAGTGFSIGGSE